MRGACGMLHLGVADCVGQKPVVKTRTNRSTLYRLVCNQINKHVTKANCVTVVILQSKHQKHTNWSQVPSLVSCPSLSAGEGRGVPKPLVPGPLLGGGGRGGRGTPVRSRTGYSLPLRSGVKQGTPLPHAARTRTGIPPPSWTAHDTDRICSMGYAPCSHAGGLSCRECLGTFIRMAYLGCIHWWETCWHRMLS